MPSIELVCIGQREPSDFSYLPLAVDAEVCLRSHRSPSHWQARFDQLQGCMYHLGSPHLKKSDAQGFFTAFELVENTGDSNLVFLPGFVQHVQDLVGTLLAASPVGQVVFTSDYQFAESEPSIFEHPLAPAEFWRIHDSQQLMFNAWYQLSS